VVDLSPVESLKKPVTLEQIKADEQLKDMAWYARAVYR
jgi:predicted RNA-binding protein with PUA-like domain